MNLHIPESFQRLLNRKILRLFFHPCEFHQTRRHSKNGISKFHPKQNLEKDFIWKISFQKRVISLVKQNCGFYEKKNPKICLKIEIRFAGNFDAEDKLVDIIIIFHDINV